MKFSGSLGMTVLSIYLILIGIGVFIPSVAIPAIILGALALAAGILILIGR